ncbi:MAG TPA: DNA ligase D [Acetobacteraceae bacterium]|nr:DNA ligase D [Acetobacteraceae bacterium]
MSAAGLEAGVGTVPLDRLPGARRAELTTFIEPCDPTPREHPPRGDEWVYEIKADGYRAQVHVGGGRVTVYSRGGLDWTDRFGAITDAAARLAVRNCILDGEAVVYGATGRPDFQALRRALGKGGTDRMRYHAFDVLALDGYDLRLVPYLDRKLVLQGLLAGAAPTFIFVEYLEADGELAFEHACRIGLEGLVAKRRDSVYRSGRVETWIKLKCVRSDTFPIVAFVEKLGARPRRIASLYLGRREDGQLLYAGKAQSGYTQEDAVEVRERLDPFIRKDAPLSVPVRKPKATWVEPVLDAEIEYAGMTDDGLLRAPVFKGLRDDLATVPVSQPSAGRGTGHGGVPPENILQLLPDAVVPSKAELEAYWRKVGKHALRHLGGRPLKLVRHTGGVTFYHKGKLPPIPPSVHALHIQKREGGEGVRVWVDSMEGLLGLVEMDAVELHPWAATVADIERPDRLIFDLDPGSGVAWEFVVETALKLRTMLEGEGHRSWPKLTGGTGLHLMVPVVPHFTHDEARIYCRSIAQRLQATAPEKFTLGADPALRPGRIFIDYLRNGRGTTAIGAYSPRARPGFPVAAPVTWKEVEAGIRPDAYSIAHPPRRG